AADDAADAEQRRPGLAEHPLEREPALVQRPIAIVGLPVAQDVEHDERDALKGDGSRFMARRLPSPAPSRRLPTPQMDPALQLLESGRLAFAVERDDFAVEDERLLARARPAFERGGDLRELAGFLVAKARPETYRGTGLLMCRGDPSPDLYDGANTVVLRFV